MSKYVICAKEYHRGDSQDDETNPLRVTEIATELVITRLYCIMLLKDSKIDTSWTIVTTSERKCLYENIFDNVIDWNTYDTKHKKVEKTDVIDLLEPSLFNRLSSGKVHNRPIPYIGEDENFYQNWDRDKVEITNINFSSLNGYYVSSKFVCILIRTRKAWEEKNLPSEYWRELIEKLESKNIKVFIFGKETDEYSTDKTKYVKNFRDWCSIVRHPNCKVVLSTISGGVYPVFICGNKNLNLMIIDNEDEVKGNEHDPSWYNDCINFTKVNKEILTYLPDVNEISNKIARYIK